MRIWDVPSRVWWVALREAQIDASREHLAPERTHAEGVVESLGPYSEKNHEGRKAGGEDDPRND
jgi:hypothetical protein